MDAFNELIFERIATLIMIALFWYTFIPDLYCAPNKALFLIRHNYLFL